MSSMKEKEYHGWFFRHAVHLGFAAVLLAVSTAEMLGLPRLPLVFLLAMWLCTQWFYSISDGLSSDWSTDRNDGKPFLYYLLAIAWLPLTAIALLVYDYNIKIIYVLGAEALRFWPFILLVASYYPVRMYLSRHDPRIAFLKPIVVGGVWAWWVTVVPMVFVYSTQSLVYVNTGRVWQLAIYLGVLFSWISAVSDFRDVEIDRRMGFPTWASYADSAKVKAMATCCFLAFGTWICVALMSDWIHRPSDVGFLFAPYLAASACTAAAHKKRGSWFFVWAVDGILYLTALCFYLLQEV